jgi:hypothetical protein
MTLILALLLTYVLITLIMWYINVVASALLATNVGFFMVAIPLTATALVLTLLSQ